MAQNLTRRMLTASRIERVALPHAAARGRLGFLFVNERDDGMALGGEMLLVIQQRLGHLAARAVVDADEEDLFFHGVFSWAMFFKTCGEERRRASGVGDPGYNRWAATRSPLRQTLQILSENRVG